ncbi:unnamed protein product, partial [Vitis vinifera]
MRSHCNFLFFLIQPGLACTVGKISVSLLPLMLDSLCRGSRVPTPSFPLLPCRRPPFHRRNLSSPPKLLFSRSFSLFRPFRLSEPFSLSPPTDPRTRMRPCRRCYSEGPGLETSRTSKILWNCSSYTPQVTPLPPFPTRHSRFRGPPPQVHRTLTRRKTKDSPSLETGSESYPFAYLNLFTNQNSLSLSVYLGSIYRPKIWRWLNREIQYYFNNSSRMEMDGGRR